MVKKEDELLLLGGLLQSQKRFAREILQVLIAGDFSTSFRRAVWSAIEKVALEGDDKDSITVLEVLRFLPDNKKSIEYLTYMLDISTPVKSTIRRLAKEIKEHNLANKMRIELQKLQTSDIDIVEMVDALENNIRNIQQQLDISIYQNLPTINIDDYIEWLVNLPDSGFLGLDTGFPIMNKYTGGLSGLWVMGAGPKNHKSTLALQIASNIALQGIPVVVFDLENGKQRLLRRLHARFSRMGLMMLRDQAKKGVTADKEYHKGIAILSELSQHLYIVTDRNKMNLPYIESLIRVLQERYKTEKMLLMFDSLQKLPSKLEVRRLQIDAWLHDFEYLKNMYNINILAISEQSRTEKGYTPRMDKMKESGEIEYSCDELLGIFKPDSSLDEYQIIILASRDGIEGIIPTTYKPMKPFWYLEETS